LNFKSTTPVRAWVSILNKLSQKEVDKVVMNGIEEYNKRYPNDKLSIEGEALKDIFIYSEGYPHFVQQICYSAFSVCESNQITHDNVLNGIVRKGGAYDLIGDRYYKDLFFNRIKAESYRNILRIMAKKWNSWISKDEIRKEFKGKLSSLNHGLNALRNRNIILSKKGTRGLYRLQWVSFAFWIQNYTKYSEKT